MKIAFGYKKRVGKDTAVEYLENTYGGVNMKFADPLYNILKHAQKICMFKDEKDRKFLQWVGTEWAREKDPDIWVKLFFQNIGYISPTDNIYCSDVRFINEFEALKKDGWICVKIIGKNNQIDDHESENQLDSLPNEKWDYVIPNKGTKDEFYTELDAIVYELTNKKCR